MDPQRGPEPAVLQETLELGINCFDTSNSYSDGTSEEILGRAIRDLVRRDEVVIATKVFYPTSKNPNGRGLSRKAIMTEVEASLRRLGTDYIDLYQIHRWDHETPIEETLEALHDVVKAGKARYLVRHRCSRGNSARRSTWRTSAAGRGSPRCRTTTTSSTARKSVR